MHSFPTWHDCLSYRKILKRQWGLDLAPFAFDLNEQLISRQGTLTAHNAAETMNERKLTASVSEVTPILVSSPDLTFPSSAGSHKLDFSMRTSLCRI